jgi:dipeptidyl aminopeptidase/acylaminoacyl peptidase
MRQHRAHRRPVVVALLLLAGAAPALAQSAATAPAPAVQQQGRATRANWTLAERFSQRALRSVVYSTGVQPRWLGKSDTIFYNWRDHTGSRFWLVVPNGRVKRPLFDHARLAAALSATHKKPYEATSLPFTAVNFTRDHQKIRFTVDSTRYEWHLAQETLRSIGRPSRDTVATDEEREERGGGQQLGGGGQFGGGPPDFRAFAPDSTVFVFAREHNLYLVDVKSKDTTQLTTDGAKNYTWGFRDTTFQQLQQQQQQDGETQGDDSRSRDPRVRPQLVWSPDSKAFAIVRTDQRKVKELYLVNVLSDPRPTLSSYSYAMPGEENVPQQELWVWRRGEPAPVQYDVRRYKDQRLVNVHWTVGSSEVRLVRRDRLQRNLELVKVDLASKAVTPLVRESVQFGYLENQPVRYVKPGGDMVWWSERSGWGHLYLYANDGTYKRPLTQGDWRVEGITEVDSLRGVVFFAAVGREPGENLYFRHLYRIDGDGSALTLLDAGKSNHGSTLSPSKRWIVDTYSTVETAPVSVVRDAAAGAVAMRLEEMDISRLRELGWKPPMPFTVKAADGVTDIYGNMWRPFDFDSTRRYPIVAYVYPGPQTETVNHTFMAGGVPQELAQLGFVVIQIGNRGGSPQRSNAYHSYGYFNLRDYALADKKAGIEQLAARHPWIDIDRVGIYGHSGGGFLTAAAMLLPPYNEFFKVGVSSSGNHDNNIYNQNWSEQHHGLRLLARLDRGAVQQAGGARRDSALAGVARPSGPSGANGAARAAARAVLPDSMSASDDVVFDIRVPTNIELAANLKGRLLLTTGDMDNNVHPGNTIRLVNALIRANKRFDFMLLPGQPHGYGPMQPYFNHMLMEYFAEHLLGDYYRGSAEIR